MTYKVITKTNGKFIRQNANTKAEAVKIAKQILKSEYQGDIDIIPDKAGEKWCCYYKASNGNIAGGVWA